MTNLSPKTLPDPAPRHSSRREDLRGALLTVFASLCFSQNFVSSRFALQVYNPETFCAVWFLAGAAYAYLYLTFTRQPRYDVSIGRSWRELVGIGVIYAFGSLAGFSAIRLIDPTIAAFANRTQTPFMILLGILFLHERPRRTDWIGIGLCLTGLLLTSYASGRVVALGLLLMVTHALCYSLATMLAKKIAAAVPPAVIAMYRSLFTGLGNLLFGLASGRFVFRVVPANLAVLLGGAFFGPFLGHVALFNGLKRIQLSRASLCLTMQPVFVALMAWPLLHLFPTSRQLAGGGFILAGVMLIILARQPSAGAGTKAG